MTYSIWLEPALDDKRYLFRTISRLAKSHNAPVFSPHITLYSSITDLSLARKALCDCKALQSIRTGHCGLGSSDYLWKTLYVKIRPDRDLLLLHQTLKDRLHTNARYIFKPHISLIYKKLQDGVKKRIISEMSLKSVFEFDKIAVIRSSKTVQNWKRVCFVRLK